MVPTYGTSFFTYFSTGNFRQTVPLSLWAGSEHRESPLLFTLRSVASQITVHGMILQGQPKVTCKIPFFESLKFLGTPNHSRQALSNKGPRSLFTS